MTIRKGKEGDLEGGKVYTKDMEPTDGSTNLHQVKNKGSSDHVIEKSGPRPSTGKGKVVR